ncbi:neprilysin-11-like [Paramacrobiotus metropolitanus]|uniref:neprilysin-11-like n=1 Tax=Paramacrobiotus metropolitanus TaxID=2943436 RepID=UPI002445C388|nr:neprilysin-11-like [Paramacrobiotus metropolitanus]
MTITVQKRNESQELIIDTTKRKSNASRYIAGTIVVLLALSIAFIVLYVQEVTRDPNEGKVDRSIRVCLTPECVHAAGTLVTNMNRNVNPCNDFYEFACGNWNLSHPMPDAKSRYSTFDQLDEALNQNLKRSLTRSSRHVNPSTATDKLQDYYYLCTNSTLINDADSWTALLRELTAFNMGLENWPFENNTGDLPDFSPDQLVNLMSHARRQGNMLGVFNTVLFGDPNNTANNVINFEVPVFALQRNYYLNKTDPDMIAAREAYKRYGMELASVVYNHLHNETSVPEDFDQIFTEIVEFEAALMNATLPREQTLDETKLQHPTQLRNIAGYTTAIGLTADNWVEYFKKVWPMAQDKINADLMVNVRQPDYYDALNNELAARINSTRFFAQYIGFKVIESYLRVLPDDVRAVAARFENVLSGTTAQPPRWETCIDMINAQLPKAVGSMYVQKYFRREAKEELEEMIVFLMDSFKKIIQESYWMDEDTRAQALAKANKFTSLVAYEDYLMNDTNAVNAEHTNFTVKDDLLGTFITAQNFVVDVEGKKLLRPNEVTDWITGAAVVNAFYMPDYNSISFPSGILAPPFLGHGYPKFWNYAAIGTVIGHEITHGFDNQGSQVDGDGKLVDWWSKESKAEFRKRADGIVKQYSSYSYLGSQLNGEGNQGENIADNGGIKESFMAYQAYIQDKRQGKPEDRLPGFHDFTPEQMFYLSYAQVWCSDYTPQEMKKQLSRPHSPGRYRVIGPLQNSPTFAQAYRCAPAVGNPPIGSENAMNPETKYAVW